jgi:Rrf2 family protein
MRLSLQSQYAICGMFDLAYHGGDGPIQVRVIGERQKIPGRYLEQIFQRLRKADLVRGKRGPGGGYVLARPSAEIHLAQVVEAVEGPLAESLGAGPPPRDRPVPARPDFLWPELAGRLEHALASVTLASLCREAAAGALERANADDRMWHI